MNKLFIIILIYVLLFSFVYSEDIKVDEDKIKLGDIEVSGVKGLDVSLENGLTTINLGPSNSISIKSLDGDFEYGDFKASSKILLNDKGEIVEASFSNSKSRRYSIGKYKEFYVPENSNVLYKDGKISLGIVANNKILTPESVPDGGKISYVTNEGFSFELENGEKFTGKLSFDSEGSFIDGKATIGAIDIPNPDNQKMYFDFKGELNSNYNSPYISMNSDTKKLVIATNGLSDSPEVIFNKGNPYLLIEDKDFASIKVLGHEKGSYVWVKDVNDKIHVPEGEIFNNVEIKQDNKIVNVNTNTKKFLVSDTTGHEGSSTTPIDFAVYRSNADGEKINFFQNGERFLVGNDIQFAWGTDTSKLYAGGYIGSGDVFHEVSNLMTYNYPTVESFEKMTGINIGFYGSAKSLTSDQLRMLFDFYDQAPSDLKNSIKGINFIDSYTSSINKDGNVYKLEQGRAQVLPSDNNMYIPISSFSDSPTTQGSGKMAILFHESAHLYHFLQGSNMGLESDFTNEWKSVSYGYAPDISLSTFSAPDKGFAYGYGSANYLEDVATYIEFSKMPDYWTNLISDKNSYSTIYRGKLAVAAKYGFMDYNSYQKIFDSAGLASDKNSINTYIVQANQKLKIQVASR